MAPRVKSSKALRRSEADLEYWQTILRMAERDLRETQKKVAVIQAEIAREKNRLNGLPESSCDGLVEPQDGRHKT